MNKFHVYKFNKQSRIANLSFNDNYKTTNWYPVIFSIKPKHLKFYPSCVWYLFHFFRVFHSRNYHIIKVIDNGLCIHRSCVFPKFFRFPFMNKDDIQIGDIWTHPNYRGKGIAKYILNEVVNKFKNKKIGIWYICQIDNHSSIKIAESIGFEMISNAKKIRFLGLNITGKYILTE